MLGQHRNVNHGCLHTNFTGHNLNSVTKIHSAETSRNKGISKLARHLTSHSAADKVKCTCGISRIGVLVFWPRQLVVTLDQSRLVQLTMFLMTKLEFIPRIAVAPVNVVGSGRVATPTAQHHSQGASWPRDSYIHRRPSRQCLGASRSWKRKGATSNTGPVLTATNSSNTVEAGACRSRGHWHRRCCLATRGPTPVRKNWRSTPITPCHDEDNDLADRPCCLIWPRSAQTQLPPCLHHAVGWSNAQVAVASSDLRHWTLWLYCANSRSQAIKVNTI
jgi:hypothetical protein